jgi:hypothetical protein
MGVGRYTTDCIVVGYLIDSEFGMYRGYESACDAPLSAFPQWSEGRQFVGEWNVQ